MSKRQAHCPLDPPCASSSPHQRIKGSNLIATRGYTAGRLINPAALHVRLEFNTCGRTAHVVYGPSAGLLCFSSSSSPFLLCYHAVPTLARLCTVQGIPVVATREHRFIESRHTRNPSCREAHDDQTLVEQDDCNTFAFKRRSLSHLIPRFSLYNKMSTPIAIPPFSDKSAIYLGPVISSGVIALFLVVARIYTRLDRTGKLQLDDWLIIFAEPLSLTGICLAIAATSYGWGKPAAYFTPEDLKKTLRLQFALQTVWIFTLWSVRLSVACSLLRFGTERLWRWPLYFVMGLQTLISGAYVVIQFAQCKPVSANWDTGIASKCWNLHPIITLGWAIAGKDCALPESWT